MLVLVALVLLSVGTSRCTDALLGEIEEGRKKKEEEEKEGRRGGSREEEEEPYWKKNGGFGRR